MHRCNIILQAANAACGEFLAAVGCKRLSLTHYPAESVHTDVLTVESWVAQMDMSVSYRVVTYLGAKIYHCVFHESSFPYSENLKVEVYRLRDIGEQAATMICNSIFHDEQNISANVLEHLPLYNELREELEQCPEELPNWLLEPGLKYHVAKNYLEVDVTEVDGYGYTMSNARVQVSNMGRNHICSADTAERHS